MNRNKLNALKRIITKATLDLDFFRVLRRLGIDNDETRAGAISASTRRFKARLNLTRELKRG